MKRKRQDITLWEACNVQKHGTMWNWWNSVRRKDFCVDNDENVGDYLDDVETIKALSGVSKSVKCQEKFLTTFSVGVKPTSDQKRVLNLMLKVTNYTYNWCLHLVNEMQMQPNQLVLQKIVCKTHSKDVDPTYRLPNDDWFFDNKMSTIKLTACKSFCTSWKSAKAKQIQTDKSKSGQ